MSDLPGRPTISVAASGPLDRGVARWSPLVAMRAELGLVAALLAAARSRLS